MRDYVLGIMRDHKGEPSSSRWLALLFFLMIVVLLVVGMLSDPKSHPFLLKFAEILGWMIVACVGAGQGVSAVSTYTSSTTTFVPPPISSPPPPVPEKPKTLHTPQ